MTVVATEYTGLITSEFNQQPNYIATVMALVQPAVDIQNLVLSLPGLYDLDVAVGTQLDAVGEWVGISRDIGTPLTGVYFAFDTAGLGWDQGAWYSPFDPTQGYAVLDDTHYRVLLRAKIAANNWDGSIAGAYTALSALFGAASGTYVFIQDNQDMSMNYSLAGNIPDAITLALFTGNYLSLRPCGVRINNFYTPSQPGPLFGFDIENSLVSGWDVGGWATITPGQ